MIKHSNYTKVAPETPAGNNWARRGICAQTLYADQMDELWWAPAGKRDAIAEAIRLCQACPVRRECLDAAIREEGNVMAERRFGIRGALQPKQRRRLYVELQRRQKAAV
ncbi:WhiB family transcriptional regulator [Streptomyces sp. NPDC055006]